MKRSNIKGFTLKVFGYFVEFVFIHFFLYNITISKPLKNTVWRLV